MSFPLFAELPRPLLVAHRGASAVAPENTLEAFDLAARLGAHVLELDVQCTADGELVVLHDAALERTTDGRGAVAAMPYAALRRLDAGCHFATRGGEHPFAGRGVVVPRLLDVLDAFPLCGFNVELKAPGAAAAQALAAVLGRVGPRQVVLAAGHDGILPDLTAACPGRPLVLGRAQAWAVLRGVLRGRVPPQLAGHVLQVPPTWWGLPVACRYVLNACRQAGIEVHVGTINDRRRAQRLLRRGVAGILSDDPAAIADLFPASRAAMPRSSYKLGDPR